MLALVYRHMGFRAESGIMRNIYLTGAAELERGITPLPMAGGRNADLAATLPVRDWFDAFALRLNPDRARGVSLALNFRIDGQELGLSVARQTEFARPGSLFEQADATISISLVLLEQLAAGETSLAGAEAAGAIIEGDAGIVQSWLELHDRFDMWFNIVTP